MVFIVSFIQIQNGFCQLIINEFQAINTSTIKDPDFSEYSDWIELYNDSEIARDVSDYILNDNSSISGGWKVPPGTVINAGEFLVIWADGKNTGLHTSFKMDGSGEEIYFFNSNGTILDSIIYGKQEADYSFGRSASDGSWVYFTEPTAGEANSEVCFSGISGEPVFSIASGFFASDLSLELSSAEAGLTIRYTINGSAPGISSPIYENPITISSTTVVRARIFQDGLLPGKIVNQSYFINEPEHELTCISLFTDPLNLWDEELGIYVNYSNDMEIPCGIEYFTDEGESAFSMNGGLQIFGGASRGFAQKSLAFYARSRYGDESIDYQLLPGRELWKYRSFILRNSGNDWSASWSGTMFRDALIHTIVENQMDLDYQSYQPVALYLNGEYWGIQNLRDKHNKDYCEILYGVNGDSLDIIKNNQVSAGDDVLYNEMMTFLDNNDLTTAANYNVAASMIDVDEFINYMITEIYSCNIDWPGNNYRLWRPEATNGKWRWMLFDTEFGFNGFQWAKATTNMFEKALDPDINDYVNPDLKAPWATRAFIKLTQNEIFWKRFASMYLSHVYITYDSERVINIIDSISKNLESEIALHIDRWGDSGGINSMSEWQDNVEGMREFARERPPNSLAHLRETFNLQSQDKVSVSLHSEEGGEIVLNGIPLAQSDFDGDFYSGLPLVLSAEANPGYNFASWTILDSEVNAGIAYSSSVNPIEISIGGEVNVIAHYEKTTELPYLHINEIVADNPGAFTDDYGEQEDWLEIYNTESFAVDIGGLYVTDSLADPKKWEIPGTQPEETTIEPGGFLVLWADNDPEQGALHLGFKLSKTGEQFGLFKQLSASTALIDSVSFPSLYAGISYIRYPDGSGPWRKTSAVSPGDFNSSVRIEQREIEDSDILLYPNPAKDIVKLSASFAEGKMMDISVVNYMGQLVYKQYFQGTESMEMDLSGQCAGFYLVKIIIEDQCFTRLLILAE